jgi:threonine synthase
MPIAAPEICRREVTVVGARLQLIDGLIGDAAAYIREQPGYFDASTLKEPYRIEGKKTMGLEIAEQLNWQLPDVIVYPTGGGVGIIGIWKALNELRDLGWIEGPLPRLVAVQSTGCAPIVRAWEKGLPESEPWVDARTVAFGITVPKALGDFLVLQAIAETGGCAIAVDDADILAEQHTVARLEGTFICPEGAANFAAIRRLRESGWIHAGEQVVSLNTGAGLKYPETVPL